MAARQAAKPRKRRANGTYAPSITQAAKRRFLAAVSEGKSLRHAATVAGKIDRRSWQRLRERDPEFAAQLEAAQEDGSDYLEDLLLEIALGDRHVNSSAQVTAVIFMLNGRRPDKYRQRKQQVEMTGKDGGPVEFRDLREVDQAIGSLVDELGPRREAKAARDAANGKVATAGTS